MDLLTVMLTIWIGFTVVVLVMFFLWPLRKSPVWGWLLFLTLPFFGYLSLLLYTAWQIEPEDRDAAFLNFFYSPYTTERGALASLLVPVLFQIPLVGFGPAWKRMLWNPKKTIFDYYELGVLSLLTLLFLGLTITFMCFAYLDLKQDIL